MTPKQFALAAVAGLQAHLKRVKKQLKEQHNDAYAVDLDGDNEYQKTLGCGDAGEWRLVGWCTHSSTTTTTTNVEPRCLIGRILSDLASGAHFDVCEALDLLEKKEDNSRD